MTTLIPMILIAAFFSLIAPSPSSASLVSSCVNDGFIPKNKVKIPVNPNASTMTEAQFNAILDQVESTYGPIVTEKGAKLVINRNWTDSTVNAYANRDGKGNWIVDMFGGLARHPSITLDGLTMVACHEVGHHLGGQPKYVENWAAAEGQSDYFATLKCLRKVWEHDDNAAIVSRITVSSDVKTKCEASFSDSNSVSICIRSAYAGLSASNLFASGATINFTTPDASIVADTDSSHPKAQCRLDTYFNGGLCQVRFEDELSDSSPLPGACTQERGATFGFRPRCWYKPDSTPTPQPTPSPTPSPIPCQGCKTYQGSLSYSGQVRYLPSSYYKAQAGIHEGALQGPLNSDFDLYLLKWNGRSWGVVKSSTGSSSKEVLVYNGSQGYYIWAVKSDSGSGSFELRVSTP